MLSSYSNYQDNSPAPTPAPHYSGWSAAAVYNARACYPVCTAQAGSAAVNQRPTNQTTANTPEYLSKIDYATGYHKSYTDGVQPQIAVGDESQSTPKQPAGSQSANQCCCTHGTFCLTPIPIYIWEPTTYETEITLEEEQAENGSAASKDREDVSITQHDTSAADILPQQTNDQTANGIHSPTFQMWSAQYYTEERMRLGLPRWESQQQRLAYECAAVDFETTDCA
jgi:hypothetical protein